jgi:glycosyltransferase involved in cell wall biosynthesis
VSTPLLLDLSRLLWRAERFAPTGIDRVELAYARHLIATARARLLFAGWWGRFGLLRSEQAIALVGALDELWSGTTVERALHAEVARMARRLRLRLLLRGGKGAMESHLRGSGVPPIYLLVSHHHLDRFAALKRFKERSSARFVFLVHDLIPVELPETVRRGQAARHRRRMDTVARLADRVIVNSAGTGAALKRHCEQLGRAPEQLVAPLGLDLPLAERPADGVSGAPYFVCIGTIEARKNHILLLEIWRDLARELGARAPRLLLIGRPGWKSRKVMSLLARTGSIGGLVEQHRALPDFAVARLLAGARALLHPSWAEGYGLPVAEALAQGVPAICSALPALREVGKNVPDYLDPADGAAWHAAILDYMDAGSLRRQAQLGRMKGWRPPSWAEHFALVEPLLEDSRTASGPIGRREDIARPAVLPRSR